MTVKLLMLILLSVLLVALLVFGIIMKLYTKRKLNDIDAFNGIASKKYLVSGKAVVIKDKTDSK